MKQPTVKLRRLTDEEITQILYRGQFTGGAYDEVKKLTAYAQFSLIKQDLEKQGIKVEVIE